MRMHYPNLRSHNHHLIDESPDIQYAVAFKSWLTTLRARPCWRARAVARPEPPALDPATKHSAVGTRPTSAATAVQSLIVGRIFLLSGDCLCGSNGDRGQHTHDAVVGYTGQQRATSDPKTLIDVHVRRCPTKESFEARDHLPVVPTGTKLIKMMVSPLSTPPPAALFHSNGKFHLTGVRGASRDDGVDGCTKTFCLLFSSVLNKPISHNLGRPVRGGIRAWDWYQTWFRRFSTALSVVIY